MSRMSSVFPYLLLSSLLLACGGAPASKHDHSFDSIDFGRTEFVCDQSLPDGFLSFKPADDSGERSNDYLALTDGKPLRIASKSTAGLGFSDKSYKVILDYQKDDCFIVTAGQAVYLTTLEKMEFALSHGQLRTATALLNFSEKRLTASEREVALVLKTAAYPNSAYVYRNSLLVVHGKPRISAGSFGKLGVVIKEF